MIKLAVVIDDQLHEVEINGAPGKGSSTFEIAIDGQPATIEIPAWEKAIDEWHWFTIDGKAFEIDIDTRLRWIKSPDGLHSVDISDLKASAPFCPINRDSHIKAPIPGLVTAVFVEPGQKVEAGQSILILEAMKMENEISAPLAGVVSSLNVTEGQSVQLGEILAEISSS